MPRKKYTPEQIIEIFTTLLEAKVLIEQWRCEYNHICPHSYLGYKPAAPESICPPSNGLGWQQGLTLEVVQ